MFYTYIIYSKNIDKYYTGYTEYLNDRIRKHNANHKGFTGKTSDWVLVYSKEFDIKTDALAFETKIKKWKSRKMIENLIQCDK